MEHLRDTNSWCHTHSATPDGARCYQHGRIKPLHAAIITKPDLNLWLQDERSRKVRQESSLRNLSQSHRLPPPQPGIPPAIGRPKKSPWQHPPSLWRPVACDRTDLCSIQNSWKVCGSHTIKTSLMSKSILASWWREFKREDKQVIT